jgi:hypothetical protein
MQSIVRYTGGAANRQEQRTSSLALCLAQVEVQLREGIVCGTLAAVSSSNLVGGEITSTCRPTQALRSGYVGFRIVKRYERNLFS